MNFLLADVQPDWLTGGRAAFALANAVMNGVATVLIVAALAAVKRRRYALHGGLMIAALVVSAAFLASYLYSKYRYGETTTAALDLQGYDWLRTLYLVVLIPHVILAVVMLPPIGMAVWRASQKQWDWHKRWSRPAAWMWLYVSVTGVIVYVLLFHLMPAAARA